MRVLMVANLFPPAHDGGYEVACAGAADEFARQGHEVAVLVSNRPLAADATELPLEVHRTLRVYNDNGPYPQLSLAERWNIERHNRRAMDAVLASFRPSLVSWWNMSGLSLALLQHVQWRRIPSLAMVCDWWPRGAPELDRWMATWQRHPRAAIAAGGVTRIATKFDPSAVTGWAFVSHYLKESLESDVLFGVNGAVLQNGYDGNLFGPSPRPEWGRRLLFLGRISPEKGLDTALKALSTLPPSYELTVIGDGAPEAVSEMRQLAVALDIANRVRWLGGRPRAELPSRLAAADALVFPVRWPEPWGLVPLEAMASGVPVVAVRSGGASEYMEAERNVLAVDADDHDALANAVTRLERSPALRQRLTEHGLETAAQHPADEFNRRFVRLCEQFASPR